MKNRPPLYRIRDWDKHFENNRSRRIEKLSWVAVPNKHDGEGYLTIMDRPDGIKIYGCWHLILQVASKCVPRGTLIKDDGTPHTARSIALKSGWRQDGDIQLTLDCLSSPEIHWIEQLTDETSPERHLSVTRVTPVWHRREGKERTERTERKQGGGVSDNPEGGVARRMDDTRPPPSFFRILSDASGGSLSDVTVLCVNETLSLYLETHAMNETELLNLKAVALYDAYLAVHGTVDQRQWVEDEARRGLCVRGIDFGVLFSRVCNAPPGSKMREIVNSVKIEKVAQQIPNVPASAMAAQAERAQPTAAEIDENHRLRKAAMATLKRLEPSSCADAEPQEQEPTP